MNNKYSNYLSDVKEQYEQYPYPPRDADLEQQRIALTELDALGTISHYCFNGKLDPNNGIRVLVAGGGTGDATIFLAEQLREYDAEVVHLDLSAVSMQIAKRRAEVRRLANITWVQHSILDLPKLDLGKYDYINSCGVLHHLENPEDGLSALKYSLKENGAIGIMVYAKYGRTGIYHMQELMRLLNLNESNLAKQVQNTSAMFASLPESHCLKNGPTPLSASHAAELTDSDIVDLFLHSQDRAYTVTEIYDWLTTCKLKLLDFACQRNEYKPETHISDAELLQKIKKLPVAVQQAIAENMVSTITRHRFYASAEPKAAPRISDHDNIPYFSDMVPLTPQETRQLQLRINKQPTASTVSLGFKKTGVNVSLPVRENTKTVIRYIDGERSIKKIIQAVKRDPESNQSELSNNIILREIKRVYDIFSCHNLLLLRNKNVDPYKSYNMLQG